jgi:hypothetical protein
VSAREQVHALADTLPEDQLRAIVAFARYLEDEEQAEPISDEEFRARLHAAEEIEVDEETKAMLKAARADREPLTSLEEIERRYGI